MHVSVFLCVCMLICVHIWYICDYVCFAHSVTCIMQVCVVIGVLFCVCVCSTRVNRHCVVTALRVQMCLCGCVGCMCCTRVVSTCTCICALCISHVV